MSGRPEEVWIVPPLAFSCPREVLYGNPVNHKGLEGTEGGDTGEMGQDTKQCLLHLFLQPVNQTTNIYRTSNKAKM